ncbi:MAG: hypothetical protein ACYTEX_11260 [Planctomycetota bacterium]|jgi:hypothetical protein
MIREALEYLAELANGKILEAHGKAYSKGELVSLPAPESSTKPISVHSLSGFVDFTKTKIAKKVTALVVGPREVILMSDVYGDWKQRDTYAKAEPFVGRDFPFGRYLDVETFIVGLKTSFVDDEQVASILRLVGNLQASAVRTVEDDGISQEVTVRKGVAKVGNEVVASPVELRPFRTFQDIEQPSSRYVLRLNGKDEGVPSVALFEVDDKLWQLTAVRDIKKYLDEYLPDVLTLA